MKYTGKNDEYFEVSTLNSLDYHLFSNKVQLGRLSLIWFQEDGNVLLVDGQERTYNKNEIICLTEFYAIEIVKLSTAKMIRFNKFFYCVVNYDSAVGCRGVLFYGTMSLPVLSPNNEEVDILSSVWRMLELEMKSQDSLQLEMLQMMLKRILILCTRLYKEQEYDLEDKENHDLIRDFLYQVELNFRTKKTVSEYAELLNRSPKTLSNVFKLANRSSPLQIIHNRIALEAKRLLINKSKTISEIGYDLGFSDIQTFSRFFKKNTKVSPSDYQDNVSKISNVLT